MPNKLPENTRKTYRAIAENPASTIRQLSSQLGFSERTIKSHQSLLKEAGLIQYVGSRKDGYWKILDTDADGS